MICYKFSMVMSLVRDRFYINEVVFGTAFGILMGPYVTAIFNPRSWDGDVVLVTREIMRLVLATGLFAIGVELPKSYMAKHAKSLIVMVVPTMAIGWIIVAGGRYAKKHVPVELRRILAAESAANDGLAYPFLTISLYLTLDRTREEAITHWVLIGCLYQVTMGTLIGAILGLIFSNLMKFSYRHGFLDRESYITQYLAFSIFTAGFVSTIGSDDLLAAFAAGKFDYMGVGAIFISSLALSKLPAPHNPPQTQQELLAITLEAIIGFIVFCSIFIHGLSIPLFSFIKRKVSPVVFRKGSDPPVLGDKVDASVPPGSDLSSSSATLPSPRALEDQPMAESVSLADHETINVAHAE
ncbi:hypothetical protein H0H92_015717 [Tricholoma furcatifolium]|nr:hypothetical protein H0H92_015717 [Tricholoma furcatifolium]